MRISSSRERARWARDMVAECLESGGGRPNCVGNVGIDLGVRADGVIEEPDTEPPVRIPPDEIGVGHRPDAVR